MQTIKIMMVREGDEEQIKTSNPGEVAEVCKYLRDSDREQFIALHLNAKNRINAIETISIGSLSMSVVEPREVFKGAILANAATIILVHNHPSGDPTPSRDDIAVTDKLQAAGEVLNIKVLDHVIIGDKQHGYHSLKENGEMRK